MEQRKKRESASGLAGCPDRNAAPGGREPLHTNLDAFARQVHQDARVFEAHECAALLQVRLRVSLTISMQHVLLLLLLLLLLRCLRGIDGVLRESSADSQAQAAGPYGYDDALARSSGAKPSRRTCRTMRRRLRRRRRCETLGVQSPRFERRSAKTDAEKGFPGVCARPAARLWEGPGAMDDR